MMTAVDVTGLDVLGAYLAQPLCAVSSLFLAANRLGSVGLRALAAHLVAATSLTDLDVSKNFVQSSSITTSAYAPPPYHRPGFLSLALTAPPPSDVCVYVCVCVCVCVV